MFRKKKKKKEEEGEGIELSDEQYISLLYQWFLRRPPDPAGYEYYRKLLAKKTVTREELIRNFIRSPEFNRIWREELWELIHELRKQLVAQLPPAQVIIDLGGADRGSIEGALYSMGYPHRAQHLYIVELPPEERELPALDSHEERVHQMPYGTIEYHYSSMTDLSAFADEMADLVWAGQSIEHVTPSEADQVLAEVRRVLKPKGYFCLDTPNGRIARLHSPHKFIDSDHKVEYTYEELHEKLLGAGFTIVEAKGICPLPCSTEKGLFDNEELCRNAYICSEPEISYLMFFKCQKS